MTQFSNAPERGANILYLYPHVLPDEKRGQLLGGINLRAS